MRIIVFAAILCLFAACAETSEYESERSVTETSVDTLPADSPVVPGPVPARAAAISAFRYIGSFKMTGAAHGEDSGEFPVAKFKYNPTSNSFYYIGRTGSLADPANALAEFPIPALVKSSNLDDLNAGDANAIQGYIRPWNRISSNPQGLNRIMGMYFKDGQLIINAEKYYDADADNSHTTFVFENANDLVNSPISSFYSVQGAEHTSGWVSEIPLEWQPELGGSHIFGNASNLPIAARHSPGPTAFIVDVDEILNSSPKFISSMALIDYSLQTRLHDDNYNLSGTNKLWTDVSRAQHGFIVPGTQTYMVVGYSGGHNTYVGYKITQDNGNVCGGPCPYGHDDWDAYYWMYDVNDMIEVKNGTKQPYELRPYEYGVFTHLQFQNDMMRKITGADFDYDSNRLFIVTEHSEVNYHMHVVSVYEYSE